MPTLTATWKILAGVAPGPHKPDPDGCQDFCQGREVRVAGQSYLLLASADGAGSARMGGPGARLAVVSALDRLRKLVRSKGRRKHLDLSDHDLSQVLAGVRQDLTHAAQAQDSAVREWATTLTLAVAGPRGTIVAQVGDGAAVLGLDGAFRLALWPDRGEYVNTTRFVTEADPGLRCVRLPPADAVALLTDGLQPVALDLAAREPFAPFFAGFFAELRKAEPETLVEPLRTFLRSPGLRQRTDDDVSLLLAVRREGPDAAG